MSLAHVVYVEAETPGAKLWLKANYDALSVAFRELHSDTVHRLGLKTEMVAGIVLYVSPENLPRIELTVPDEEHARKTTEDIRRAIVRCGGNVDEFEVGSYGLDIIA
ncbi:MAG: hypothetical protein E6K61_13440 [Nitrospirae bacterium]|nr:MAG: hypothetical protein E6K61_13440 [Nitrospirota bacterium]